MGGRPLSGFFVPFVVKSFVWFRFIRVRKIKFKYYKKEERIMDKYVCSVCGYVYDPEDGDPG